MRVGAVVDCDLCGGPGVMIAEHPRHDGPGTWRQTPRHESAFDVLVSFIACLIAVVVFVGLVTAGRAVMCASHQNHLSYCPGYEATQP